MAWRTLMISTPAHLSVQQNSLKVAQTTDQLSVPLEDISVLLIDQPQVSLTAPLLSACAEHRIALITVGANHHPNGVLQPFCSHSRALKVIHQQLAIRQGQRKRLWQTLVRQKIHNQSQVLLQCAPLEQVKESAQHLKKLGFKVKPGDPDNLEAQASKKYFPLLFGRGFVRKKPHHINSRLNYGYAIIRAALARNIAAYGFIPALGLHHHSEQNAFNLADDLIEPYRPLLDAYVLAQYRDNTSDTLEISDTLETSDKVKLAQFLHQDIAMQAAEGQKGHYSVLAALEATVISLSQRLNDSGHQLHLPVIASL